MVLAGKGGGREEGKALRARERQAEVARPPLFNREAIQVADFVMDYKLYIKEVEEQVQRMLTYVQGELANV